MEKIKVYKHHESTFKAKKILYFILGALEVLLLFRFSFKLLGANPGSDFVAFIYTGSGIFLAPFMGIFGASVNNGIETSSVFDPATLIAMLVYALIAYGIGRLIDIYGAPKNKAI